MRELIHELQTEIRAAGVNVRSRVLMSGDVLALPLLQTEIRAAGADAGRPRARGRMLMCRAESLETEIRA